MIDDRVIISKFSENVILDNLLLALALNIFGEIVPSERAALINKVGNQYEKKIQLFPQLKKIIKLVKCSVSNKEGFMLYQLTTRKVTTMSPRPTN